MRKICIMFILLCIFISCKKNNVLSINSFNNEDVFDLTTLCDKPYDFLLIVAEGYYLSCFDLSDYGLESPYRELYQWCGEKIYFISNNKIIEQINVDYYISEPKDNYGYISFFPVGKSHDDYIYRDYNNSIFRVKTSQNLKYGSYCYYLE